MSFFEFPHTRTYDSDLGWIIRTVHTHDEVLKALDEWAEHAEVRISDLEEFKKAMENGDLPQGVINGLYEWASTHLYDLIAKSFKGVFFEITLDGYFVAYLPDSWSDITFNTTGLDIFPDGVDFGHLTLSY